MRKNNLLFLIIILFLSACGREKEIEYYENGTVKTEAEINGDDKLNGKFIAYYPDGQIEAQMNYTEGKIDGIYKTYYKDGTIRNLYHYKKGQKDGVFKIFYPNGDLKIIGRYYKDEPDSLGYEYFDDGEIQRIYKYNKGKLEYLKGFDKSGNIIQSTITPIVNYKEDSLKIGINYSYADSAKVWIVFGNVKDGILIDTLGEAGSPKGELYYKIHKSDYPFDKISGKILEVKLPDYQIIGESIFEYNM